jgi:GH35 family endo-1,4-beta-xylanase
VLQMKRFESIDLDIIISRLEVKCSFPCNIPGLQRQATTYAQVFHACLQVGACRGVFIAGVSDNYTTVDAMTLPGSDIQPYMFDKQYQMKAAGSAVVSVLHSTARARRLHTNVVISKPVARGELVLEQLHKMYSLDAYLNS